MAHPTPGPDAQLRLSEGYVQLIAREAYFWAWPLVDVFARRQHAAPLPAGHAPGLLGGQAVLALDASPMVLQVPDFGDRFWGIHVFDARTDSVARLGRVYGSAPGAYLLVGPGWVGEIPPGIRRVFAARTETVMLVPQVAAGVGAATLLDQLRVLPVADFEAQHARARGRHVARERAGAGVPASSAGRERLRRDFRQLLPGALASAPALPGEGARYRELLAVLDAAQRSTALGEAFDAALEQAERQLLAPLDALHRFGRALPHHWSTLANTASFGTDYFARTLAARADPYQPPRGEVASFHLGCDAQGEPLDARRRYTLHFAAGAAPPVRAFWSLALGPAAAPRRVRLNGSASGVDDADGDGDGIGAAQRAIVSHGVRPAADGTLTLHLQKSAPGKVPDAHWLPLHAAGGHAFSLCLRCHWPEAELLDGHWQPPAVTRIGRAARGFG